MSGRVPKPLQAALTAMLATLGAGGGVYVVQQEHASKLYAEYMSTVAADTSTSDAIKLAMVLGSYYESSFKHIGTPYVDKLGKGQPLTVCNGVTGPEVVAGRYYAPADCYRLEVRKYLDAERIARGALKHWGSYNPWVRASFIDVAYNVPSALAPGTTLLAKANAGDLIGACQQMPRWVFGTVGGVKTRLPGLVERRDTTQELCTEWGRDGHFSAAAVAALGAKETKR